MWKHVDPAQWFDTIVTFVFFWPVALVLHLDALGRAQAETADPGAALDIDHPLATDVYDALGERQFGIPRRYSQGYFSRYRW